jgi:uncharacterized protein (DUF433 family)
MKPISIVQTRKAETMNNLDIQHIEVAPGIVRRKDRGLCVAGTRISLYLIMDYLKDGWPPHILRHQLLLSEEQMNPVMDYLNSNADSFEAEYDDVMKRCAEREAYWRERQKKIKKEPNKSNFTPEQAVAWAKLAAYKRERKREAA